MISILNAYHVFSYKHLYVQKKISIIWVIFYKNKYLLLIL